MCIFGKVMKNLLTFIYLLTFPFLVVAQPCDKLNLTETHSYEAACAAQSMTLTFDLRKRPYVYVANKEAGLSVLHIKSNTNLEWVAGIPIDTFNGLEVMGVSQYGNRLYLALGNFFSTKQSPAMAVIDITDPTTPKKIGFWRHLQDTEGSSIVKVEGNFAYLAAFSHGLFVLDIQDLNAIRKVSQFVPVLNYPDANPDATKINARGLVIQDDVIYLCYDAGGIRIINVSNKTKPRETGRYSNPIMTGKPRAYNNAVLRDSLLYVGVDYCGVEILNISDTANIKLTAWWNPWKCQTNPLNWFSSNGHVNEIVLDSQENKLFVSTGKSDLYVIDVSDPTNPDSCSIFGGISNAIGTWGVNRFENRIGLAYICTVIPFSSNWSGVKLLAYTRKASVREQQGRTTSIYPNPTTGHSQIQGLTEPTCYTVYTPSGHLVQDAYSSEGGSIDMTNLESGVYLLNVLGYTPLRVVIIK
jgi:hypothetical protein